VSYLFFGAQRRRGAKKKPLCGFASLREFILFLFSQRKEAAKNLGKLLAPFLLCVILFFSYREIAPS
jgi:hypothetical protein